MVVVFAIGNGSDEMTMNTFAAASWVIPVAAGSKAAGIAEFSSGGIDLDLRQLGADPQSMAQRHPEIAWGSWTVTLRNDLATGSLVRGSVVNDFLPSPAVTMVAAIFS